MMHTILPIHAFRYRRAWILRVLVVWGLCCWAWAEVGFAQSPLQRCRWVRADARDFVLDTLTILPQSVRVRQRGDSTLRLNFEPNSGRANFAQRPLADSVLVCWQALPFALTRAQFRRDKRVYDSTDTYIDNYFKNQNVLGESREELFNLKGIQKTGNLTRGVSFGNTQNAFVTSALNLQLEGQLTPDIHLTAAISDQSVPYQPEGNTLQLQQFDRVFIQLRHRQGTLTMGDIALQNREGYFLRYYKNIQGAALQARYRIGADSATTGASVAVAKGKFASIQVQALEGVQGPYRLTGPNQETFIIIIANSERVFIDGRQLTRGFNNDYVIDYNQAEIIFNANVLITQFTRIRVDFEYAERNYGRSLQTVFHEQNLGKWQLGVNYYREADNPRNPLISLSEADQRQLSLQGDRAGVINAIDSVGFVGSEIRYRVVDTLVAGQLYRRVLVYSADATQAFFRASFTQVGQGRGDYVRRNTTLNGQVYAWVAPVNGVSQGDFAPVRVVPLPLSRQLITARLGYQYSKSEKISLEMGISNRDLNRYSSIDDADNQGQAFRLAYTNGGKPLGSSAWAWYGETALEYNSTNFHAIDRFRSIEYDRDWQVRADTSAARELIATAKGGIRQAQSGNYWEYGLTARARTGEAQGLQHTLAGQQTLGRWTLRLNAFHLRSQQNVLARVAEWQRLNAGIEYNLPFARLAYRFGLDQNKLSAAARDSVIASLMNFTEHQFVLRSADSARITWQADYTLRTDQAVSEGKLRPFLGSQTANLRLNAQITPQQQLNITFTYRALSYYFNAPPAGAAGNENILGRLDWNARFLDKAIRSELSLAVANGRELQREYVFLRVPTGQGTHTWRDENSDGVQDLNEFYVAINPDERNFIKVFTNTINYIEAFNNVFNYRLNIDAPTQWQREKGLRYWLSKLSSTTAWNINRRFAAADLASRLLPFAPLADEQIFATQENFRTTLFYNRNNLRFGAEIQYLQTRQKQLLVNGFEARNREEIRLGTRQNLGKFFNFRWTAARISQVNRSNFLLTRNYDISTYQISPELAYQPSNELRIVGGYQWSNKRNPVASDSPETAQIQQLSAELRWTKINQRNLLATLRYWQIAYIGELNTPISYDMLEALQPGTNWTWNVNWQQRVLNGLQLTLIYEGRKSATTPIINIGRVQLTALF